MWSFVGAALCGRPRQAQGPAPTITKSIYKPLTNNLIRSAASMHSANGATNAMRT